MARFVSAEAAESTLKIAEDGQLPQLRLQEVKRKEGPQAKGMAVNPLVLFGVISLSVVLSISLTLIDTGSGGDSDSRTVRYAREVIESEFFGDIGGDQPDVAAEGGLQPYQILLREGQRAYSQGDLKTERERYRSVLGLLWAERGPHAKGLTGSRERDQRLEDQIAIILGNQ
ncbi:MAG: hypothetical protein A2V70_14080 [Planctomycetes bacterium RBG_13_63_9]|nr:MAG: hypothetical protein A2V70_14080 [Planctomycetes bacterium RBG_13_63_9]